jgi:hypothetical protein
MIMHRLLTLATRHFVPSLRSDDVVIAIAPFFTFLAFVE